MSPTDVGRSESNSHIEKITHKFPSSVIGAMIELKWQ